MHSESVGDGGIGSVWEIGGESLHKGKCTKQSAHSLFHFERFNSSNVKSVFNNDPREGRR